MNLIEKINKVSEEAKNQFKPDLKNTARISERSVKALSLKLLIRY